MKSVVSAFDTFQGPLVLVLSQLHGKQDTLEKSRRNIFTVLTRHLILFMFSLNGENILFRQQEDEPHLRMGAWLAILEKLII